jgi:uncharacterized protein YjiS (DUF1127 family)
MTHLHVIATDDRGSAASPPKSGSRISSSIAKAWRTYWQGRAQRATVHLLYSLDDRTLHDIGVGRAEIGSLVYGRRGDRTRCYEAAWRNWHAGC